MHGSSTSTRRTVASRGICRSAIAVSPVASTASTLRRGAGCPGTEAVFLPPGEGERLEGKNRIATIKIGREELALIEFELEPGFEGPDPHTHDDHVDSFYVLEGEPEFLVDDERLRLGAGSYVAAPLGVVHAFSNPGPDHARLLNVHAPSRRLPRRSAPDELNDQPGSFTSPSYRTHTKRKCSAHFCAPKGSHAICGRRTSASG